MQEDNCDSVSVLLMVQNDRPSMDLTLEVKLILSVPGRYKGSMFVCFLLLGESVTL